MIRSAALTERKNVTLVMFTLCPLFTAEALKFNLLQFLIQKLDLASVLLKKRRRNTKQNGMDGWMDDKECESFKKKNPIQ